MIFEWLFDLGRSLAQLVLNGLPPVDSFTDLIVDADASLYPIMQGAAALSGWFPWLTLVACIGIAAGTWGVFFLLKVARVVVGHLPLVGGNG